MSNNNAAATRKRRSSILKTKPRAPLSELEFNPTTPEAATKSRRVSFSRKKDVAEFVVNEATTTWRNFYEEQNRTLESSGNESEIRPSAVKQFHEVEAEMDHTTLGKPMGSRTNLTLFSDMNFTEQLASLDCMTADSCIKAPTQNFEPSIMVERKTKVFGDSFANPLIVEHTGSIELDFSAIQQATPTGIEEQNLSDIVKEVERANPSIAGQNCFLNDFNNRSYYVEVDLNETKGMGRNDISDMSITDIIHTSDIDKENIAVESFYKPSTEVHQKHSDESVLVFDGKKLKVANIHDKLDDILDNLLPEKQLSSACIKVISNSSKLDPELDSSNTINRLSDKVVQSRSFDNNKDNYSENENILQPSKKQLQPTNRKTLISHQMSMMMDLSLDNCLENPNIKLSNNLLGMPSFNQKTLGSSQDNSKEAMLIAGKEQVSISSVSCSDLLENTKTLNKTSMISCIDSQNQGNDLYNEQGSANLPLDKNQCGKPKELLKKKLIILNHDDDLPNFTLDVPPQFGRSTMNGQKSVVYDTEDSVHSMHTTQDILRELQEASNLYTNKDTKNSSKTIFFDNDITLGDLSMTKAVLVSNCDYKQKTDTLITKTNAHSIETIPPEFPRETNRKTIIFERNDDLADITLTQEIQTSNKRKTLAMSMTHEKKDTIVFDECDALADLSMTQAIPKVKCVISENSEMADLPATQNEPQLVSDEGKTLSKVAPICISQDIPQTCSIENILRRQTILFGNDDVLADLSMTQAIQEKHGKTCNMDLMSLHQAEHKTVSKEGKTKSQITDMFVAQASSNENKKKGQTIVFDNDDVLADVSMTLAVPVTKCAIEEKSKPMCNMDLMPMDQAVHKSVSKGTISEMTDFYRAQESSNENNKKRQTIVFGKDDVLADLSMTQDIQAIKCTIQDNNETTCEIDLISMHQAIPKSVSKEGKKIPIITDMSIPRASSKENSKKRQTIVFDKGDVLADLSMTLAIPAAKCAVQGILKTICNMDLISMHQGVPKSFSKEENSLSKITDMNIAQASSNENNKKRQTILFGRDDSLADISMTLAIPAVKIDIQEQHGITCKSALISMHKGVPKSVLNDGNHMSEMTDMSIPQASSNENNKKRQTIVFDKDDVFADLSMTLAIPAAKCAIQEKVKTTCNMDLISVHQAVPKSVSKEENSTSKIADMTIAQGSSNESNKKRQTILFGKDDSLADISMTLAIPAVNIDIQEQHRTTCKSALISMHEGVPKSVLNDGNHMSEMTDMSVAHPSLNDNNKKRQTILFGKDDVSADLSMTKAIPALKCAIQEKHEPICKVDLISMQHAVSKSVPKEGKIISEITNMSIPQASSNENNKKRQTILFGKDDVLADISMTVAIPGVECDVREQRKMHQGVPKSVLNYGNLMSEMKDLSIVQTSSNENDKKRQTILFDKDDVLADVSMTQAISAVKYVIQEKDSRACTLDLMPIHEAVPKSVTNVGNYRSEITEMSIASLNENNTKRQTIVFDKDDVMADVSMTLAIPAVTYATQEKHDKSCNLALMSMNKAVLSSVSNEEMIRFDVTGMSVAQASLNENNTKTQTIVFDMDDVLADLSITQAFPCANGAIEEKHKTISYMGFVSTHQDVPQCVANEEKNISVTTDMTMAQVSSGENNKKRPTMVFDKDDILANFSMTQAVPTTKGIIQEKTKPEFNEAYGSTTQEVTQLDTNEGKRISEKTEMILTSGNPKILSNENHKTRQTIVFDTNNALADLSLTQTIPAVQCNQVVQKTEYNVDAMDITMPIPQMVANEHKKQTILFDKEDNANITDVSLTEMMSSKLNPINDMTDMPKLEPVPFSEEKGETINEIKSMPSSNNSQTKIFQKQNEKKSQPSQEMSAEELNKDFEQHRLFQNSLETNNDVQKLQFCGRSVESNKTILHSFNENKKTLLAQMVDLSNLESEFIPRAEEPLENLSDSLSKTKDCSRSHEIIKIASQSLQDGRHDDDNDIGRDTVEKHIIGNKSVITSVVTDIPSSNTINSNVEKQSSLDQLEKSLMCVTGKRRNITTEIDYQHMDKNNEVVDLLTDEIEKSFSNSVHKDNNCSVKIDETKEKEISKEVKENILKKQLTIAELLNRTERIKSFNIAVNTFEHNKSKENKNKMIQNNELQNLNISDFELNTDTRNKTLRLSKEVVKTLHFEDENTDNQENIRSQNHIRTSLIKKNNISIDISTKLNMNNPRVIPEEYNSTLNSIKDLMKELVKPNIDLPFHSTSEKKNSGKKSTHGSENKTNVTPDHSSQMHSAGLHLLNSQYNHNEISVTTRDVVHKMLTVDGIVSPISQNKTLIKQSPPHCTKINKNDVPVTEVSKEVIVPEPTDNRTRIVFDRSNPLNNVDLASVTHDAVDISLQNDRKFDISNPLNNICFNIQTLEPKTKDSVTLGHELKSEVAATFKSTNETNYNDELVDDTSCITLIDDTLDASSSIEHFDIGNNSGLLSTSNSIPRTILRNQNIDVLYMKGKEKFDYEDTADEENKTDQTRRVPIEHKGDVLLEKINHTKKNLSPRKRNDEHTTTISNKKNNDKDLNKEEHENGNIEETRNYQEYYGKNKCFSPHKCNEKDANKAETKFTINERKCDFNKKQINGNSVTDDRIKINQIEEVKRIDVLSPTKHTEKDVTNQVSHYRETNESKMIVSPELHDEWNKTDNRNKTDPKCIDENLNSRKRVLSPNKPNEDKGYKSDKLELTPNPPRKIHKMSTSPLVSCDIAKDSALDSTVTDVNNSQPLRGKIIPKSAFSKEALTPKGKKSHEIDLEVLMDESVEKEKDNEKTDLSPDVSMTEEWSEEISNAQDKLDDIVGIIDELPFMG